MDGSLGPAIVAALATLAAGPVFSFCMARSNAKREAATVRASIVAEISGLLDLIGSRNYIATLKEGASGRIFRLSVDVPESYFQVYRANLSKLGLLDPTVAESIISFYMLVEAVRQDVKPGGPLNTTELPFDQKQACFSLDAQLLEKAVDIGESLRGR